MLLLTGRLLSTLGSQVTAIAYPLLVLAVTHSPAKAGLVGFAGLLPHAALRPARRRRRRPLEPQAADDRGRRRARARDRDARGTILLDRVSFWQIAVVAFVEGTGAVFFNTAHAGALRAIVPRQQLPAAVGVIRARARP